MPQPAPSKKGSPLTRKLGPLPVWAWLLIGSAAGWYLFKRLGAQSAATTGTAANTQATDSGGSSGAGSTPLDGSGGGTASGPDISSALGANTSALQGIATQLANLQTGVDAIDSGLGQSSGSTFDPGPYATPTQPVAVGAQPGGTNAPTYHPIAVGATHFGQAARAQTRNLKAAGKTPAFGGVTSVIRLHNGSVVTTYANGRKVQQMPGKTAYVIKRGR